MRATLVLCLGNPLLRDDGVAWEIAAAVERRAPRGADVRRSSTSGLYLLEELEGFASMIVVDAVATGRYPPGTLISCPLEELRAAPGSTPHGVGLGSVLSLGRALGLEVPSRVHVVAIEVEDMTTVNVGLTPPVAAAVAKGSAEVMRLTTRWQAESDNEEEERRGHASH